MLPTSIEKAIDALSDLPGIGSRSAERLVFSLLRNQTNLTGKIAEALQDLGTNITECTQCHNYCETTAGDLCRICTSSRSAKLVCVVESPIDVLAIEKTHEFKGRYHVLHGVISPMNKVSPDDLRIASLLKRIQAPDTQEVILAMSGNVEGEATALYLTDQIHRLTEVKVSRLARGIPSGGDLDYLDVGTLSRALMDRSAF